MSIHDNEDWGQVERKALAFEKVIESHLPVNGPPDLERAQLTGEYKSDWANHMEDNFNEHFLTVPPVPPPTIEQQLAWTTVELARAKSTLHRNNSAISEAVMWLSVGETQRALECLNRALLGL